MKWKFYIKKMYKQEQKNPTSFYYCGYILPSLAIKNSDAISNQEHWNTRIGLAIFYDQFDYAMEKLLEICDQNECIYAIEKCFVHEQD